MMMFDTPEGVAYVRACARQGALKNEIAARKIFGKSARRSGGGRTAYSIIKEVYGFRGSPESVLEDLTEYIDATIRLRNLPEGVGPQVASHAQELVDRLTADDALTQVEFERMIELAEEKGAISHAFRQAMSDLFYTSIVNNIAGFR